MKPVTRPTDPVDGEGTRDAGNGNRPDLGLPASDGGGGGVSAPGSMACVSETHAVERSPADLLLLVDVSWDMAQKWVGDMTKSQAAKQALFDFVSDAKSSHLSVGLQYFPYGYLDRPCLEFDDCGHEKEFVTATGSHIGTCIRRRVCQVTGQPPGTYEMCGGGIGISGGLCGCDVSRDICLDKKDTCVAPGDCSISHKMCPEVGKPCPGSEGMCEAVWGKCFIPGNSCQPAMYEKLRVPFVDLPAGQKPLLDALDLGENQNGVTMPLAPAVKGSLLALKKRATEKGRPTAMVLVTGAATEMAPRKCEPIDPLLAKADLEAAAKGSPALPTYVIGVVKAMATRETDVVNQLAAAGGTDKAFVLDGAADIAKGLHEALSKIRGATQPCDFALPVPKVGDIDLRKVNVSLKTGAGKSDLAYVAKADRCSDSKGGWYYDADPAAGGQPKRMVLCASSCAAVRQEESATIDVAFGCQTRLE